jgi:hypothetical protein
LQTWHTPTDTLLLHVTGKGLADFYEEIPTIIRELINRLNDENAEVLKANHKALAALSTHVPAEELVNHIEFMKNLIATMVSDARRRKGGVGDGEFLLPGFNMPKGKSCRLLYLPTTRCDENIFRCPDQALQQLG